MLSREDVWSAMLCLALAVSGFGFDESCSSGSCYSIGLSVSGYGL